MTDKYTEKQLQHYENAKTESAKDDALYRIGTHLEIHEEVLPCNGNANLTQEQRDAVLDEVKRRG
jgi:ribosome maturation protein Sdo1